MNKALLPRMMNSTSTRNSENCYPVFKSSLNFYYDNHQYDGRNRPKFPFTEIEQHKLGTHKKQQREQHQILSGTKRDHNSLHIGRSNNYSSCNNIKNNKKETFNIEKQVKKCSNINILSNRENKEKITFHNSTTQLIKTLKPLHENKQIDLQIKDQNINKTANMNNNNNNLPSKLQNIVNKEIKKQNNFEKLKRLILQLDKEDFISHRTKLYNNGTPTIQNQKPNKQNSHLMTVQWKNQGCIKPCAVKPKSTMILNNIFNDKENTSMSIGFGMSKKKILNNFMGISLSSLAPRKYFSKPKTKRMQLNQQILTNDYKNRAATSPANMRTMTSNMAFGLNIIRGKMLQRKDNKDNQLLVDN